MRAITIKSGDGGSGPKVIWNVDRPVGAAKINLEDDVRLVQVLLKDIYADVLASDRSDDTDVPRLEVNGRCTDATLFWIKRFQRDKFGRVLADGVVDPVPDSGRAVSTISHTTYTIIAMNEKFSAPLFTVPGLVDASKAM